MVDFEEIFRILTTAVLGISGGCIIIGPTIRTFIIHSKGYLAKQITALLTLLVRQISTKNEKTMELVKECLERFCPKEAEKSYLRLLKELDNNDKIDFRTHCLNILSNKRLKYDRRLALLDRFFEIMQTDGFVDTKERELLENIAKYFVIKEWDILSLEYKYQWREPQEKRQSVPIAQRRQMEALRIFGLKEIPTEKEIKSRYRQLAKVYHPDTLPANASEKQKEEAETQFRQLTEAYEMLCKEQ